MAGKVRDLITGDVRNLIAHLTGFKNEEENFQLCEKFAMSNLLMHRFLSVDSHATRRSIFGIVTKFMIHGHLDVSRKLDELVNRFLDSEVFTNHSQYDIQWSLLSLLLNLASNPTSNVDAVTSTSTMKDSQHKKSFDWAAYTDMCTFIKCSNEDFNQNFNEDSNSDEFDEFSDIDDEELVKIEDLELPPEVCSFHEMQESDTPPHPEEGFKEILQKEVLSHMWLKENVQHSWWNELEITEPISSKFASASLATKWDGICEKSCDRTSTISEYKVIREILWALPYAVSTFMFKEEQGMFIVRPSVTVPSLTKDVMNNYLSHLCRYFNMMYDLHKFCQDIYPFERPQPLPNTRKLPPYTFEAYVGAVSEFLREFQEFALEIEMKVKKQDDIYTLYSLNLALEPKLLQLCAIYSVHTLAVQNWKEKPNWLAASWLLSVLYSEAMNTSSSGQSSIMLKLFLKSFRPYLDIIDIWLADGRLEDERNEFIITKNGDVADSSRDLWEEDFLVCAYTELLASSNIEALPLLQVVVNKVLYAGKSMELLHRLDRVSESRSQDDLHSCLYREFLESLENELSSFVQSREIVECEITTITELPSIAKIPVNRGAVAQPFNLEYQLVQLNDPFLMKAFQSYIPFNSDNLDSETKNIKEKDSDDGIYKRVASHLSYGQLPIKPIMERILTRLIDEKHEAACLLVKTIFQKEYQLSTHLSLIRAVFLMEAGDIMHHFTTHIFQEAECNLLWANSYALTIQLEDCIDLSYPEYSSRFSIVVDDHVGSTSSGIASSLDDIKVKYNVEWPLTLILSPSNMEFYNAVFQFLLKVKWALWALQQLRFTDLKEKDDPQLSDPKKSRKLSQLKLMRFWLLHSVGSVHTYLMGQVLHSLGLELESNIDQAHDLDSLVQVHNSYVRMVHAHCLQPKSSDVVKTAILQLVGLAIQLREVWQLGVNEVSEAKLSSMGEMYVKCHCFLGTVLQNTVETGQEPHSTSPQLLPPQVYSSQTLIKLNDNLKFVLTELAWQIGPPSGLPIPLPHCLSMCQASDVWSDTRTLTTSQSDILKGFFNRYFEYMKGINQLPSSTENYPKDSEPSLVELLKLMGESDESGSVKYSLGTEEEFSQNLQTLVDELQCSLQSEYLEAQDCSSVNLKCSMKELWKFGKFTSLDSVNSQLFIPLIDKRTHLLQKVVNDAKTKKDELSRVLSAKEPLQGPKMCSEEGETKSYRRSMSCMDVEKHEVRHCHLSVKVNNKKVEPNKWQPTYDKIYLSTSTTIEPDHTEEPILLCHFMNDITDSSLMCFTDECRRSRDVLRISEENLSSTHTIVSLDSKESKKLTKTVLHDTGEKLVLTSESINKKERKKSHLGRSSACAGSSGSTDTSSFRSVTSDFQPSSEDEWFVCD